MELGKFQTLYVIKKTDFGLYLRETKHSKEQVLLPKKEVPDQPDLEQLEVFLYRDSEDRLIATTKKPALTLGELAVLKVVSSNDIGAFLDWGLLKDLFLPYKQQTYPVKPGDEVLVSLYIDKSNRLCATMDTYGLLSCDSPYNRDDQVKGFIYEVNHKYGAYVAVDDKYSAMIPNKELFEDLQVGQRIEARVVHVLEDGKLTLGLREKAYVQRHSDADMIYQKLIENEGFLPVTDKSDPEQIKKLFHLSKNAYKRAVGKLLKERKIELKQDGIVLNQKKK